MKQYSTQEMIQMMLGDDSKKEIVKIIKFTNDDVPKYLKNLSKFREESHKVVIYVA